jgi:hypothetical protein
VNRALKLVACLVALAGSPARAHEAGDRAMGTVESIAPDRIVLQAPDGHSMAFVVTRETRFVRGRKPVGREDVRVGERAVVRARQVGERMQATLVRLAAAPASTAPRERGERRPGGRPHEPSTIVGSEDVFSGPRVPPGPLTASAVVARVRPWHG